MTSKMMISTKITKLFQCKYPILLPGMSWISTPELVAAVCNSGGVGILATGPLSVEETRQSIEKIRNLLHNPDSSKFGIGVTLLMPGATENAQIGLDMEVPIINVSLGKAEWIADGLSKYGGKMLSTVTNRKHAQGAINSGADALMITGHEAAAHGGDVTSLVGIPCIRQEFPNIPIVAAGGFATGSGLCAALSLGADAIAMGSRFAITKESPLATNTKHAIVEHTEVDTIYGTNFDGIPARVLKTDISKKAMKSRPFIGTILYRSLLAAKTMNIPLWQILPGLITQYDKIFMISQFSAATQSIQDATVNGDITQNGIQFIGQCQGLIHDIPSVENLIQQIIYDAKLISQETNIILNNDGDGD